MAYFDLTSATANAYRKTWHERRYLLRLAAMPVLVKLAFYILATSLTQGDDGTYMRFVLIMVPAFLAEGWMLSHYVRLIVLDHRWPFRPSGDFEKDMAILSVRARGILSGMIVYVLINMAVGLFVWGAMAYMMPYVPDGESGTPPQVPGVVAFLSVLILGFMFWAFRLIWLYIPYALNQDGASYLRALRGIGSSLHLIGIWLLCLLPFLWLCRLQARL